jgi:hypothetical protein
VSMSSIIPSMSRSGSSSSLVSGVLWRWRSCSCLVSSSDSATLIPGSNALGGSAGLVEGNGLRNLEDPASGWARLAVVVDALESGFLFFATGADRGFPVLEGLKGATLECEGMFTRSPALLIIPADGRCGRPGIEAIAIG